MSIYGGCKNQKKKWLYLCSLLYKKKLIKLVKNLRRYSVSSYLEPTV